MGGAITINNPDFSTNETNAYNVIQNNTFTHNQAYLSGNAIYVRFNYNSTALNTTESRVCGGGFRAGNNKFENNTAVVHSSNGGAISLTCDFTTALPNVPRSDLNMTQSQNAQTAFAEPIDLEVVVIKDYYAEIVDNLFLGNEVGQKGSAIYTRQISLLNIESNNFTDNQPGYSFR